MYMRMQAQARTCEHARAHMHKRACMRAGARACALERAGMRAAASATHARGGMRAHGCMHVCVCVRSHLAQGRPTVPRAG
eukprot:7412874-Alexandrium_andersonii.AAC.1